MRTIITVMCGLAFFGPAGATTALAAPCSSAPAPAPLPMRAMTAPASAAPDATVTDDMLAPMVTIRVGETIVGTGVAMPDAAQSVATAASAFGGWETDITVQYRGEPFRRAARLIATESRTGLAVLRPAGSHPQFTEARPDPRPDIVSGEPGTTIGMAQAFDDRDITDRISASMNADAHTKITGTSSRWTFAAHAPFLAQPLPGMAVFSPATGALLGIVVDWRSVDGKSSVVVVPAATVMRMLDAVRFAFDSRPADLKNP